MSSPLYLQLKRATDIAAGTMLHLATCAPGKKQRALATAARALRRGKATLCGAPRAIVVGGHRIPRGLFNEEQISRCMNLTADADKATNSYRQSMGLRKDVGLLARGLWVQLLDGGATRNVSDRNALDLLGLQINNATIETAERMLGQMLEIRSRLRMVGELSNSGEYLKRRCLRVSFVNANNLNIYKENAAYAAAVRNSEYVLPDGVGVKIAARLSGQSLRDNLNGTDLFPVLMSRFAREDISVFLLGAEREVLRRAADEIRHRHPGLRIAGTRDGYFGEQDEAGIAEEINASRADVVIVGMGTPRQELWMQRNQDRLDCSAILCMGGLLDFVGGKNARAPQWVRQAGFEWVYRILEEPSRMWKRYVIGNPKFLYRVWRHERTRTGGRRPGKQLFKGLVA